jgi:hypothetical protein
MEGIDEAKVNSFVSGSYKNYQKGAVSYQPTHSGKGVECFGGREY